MAISVVLQHTVKAFHMSGEYGIFRSLGSYFGVPSFFVLSSFLLTNKLLNSIDKSNKDNETKEIIVKYLIRRFFRIYVPYLVYCTFVSMSLTISVKYGYKYESWYNLVTLKKIGSNHLWTILPEIKYYLFIPIFTMIASKLQKFNLILILFIITIMLIVEIFNLFGLKCIDIPFPKGQNLFYVFQIFLNGSLLSLVYNELHNNSREFSFVKKFNHLSNYFTFAIFFYGLKLSSKFFSRNSSLCHFKYSIYWSFFILNLIFAESNHFTDFINLPILKNFGKYSFGIYLYHYEGFRVINFLKFNNYISNSNIEIIIIELFVSYLYGMIFFYLIEQSSMNFGNYLIKKIYYSNSSALIQDSIISESSSKNVILTNFLIIIYIFLILFFIFH